LKARLNAASERYPTSNATAATFVDPSNRSPLASCNRVEIPYEYLLVVARKQLP
jgi:hypothetical protein